MVRSKHERLVNIVLRCDACFVEFDALIEKRHKCLVYDESGLVERLHDRLPERFNKYSGNLDCRLGGLICFDQFDQFHCCLWVELEKYQVSVRAMRSTC